MKIVLSNIIEIQDPTKEILDYCKKELTFNNPDYIKKMRMGFSIYKTPKLITSIPLGSDKQRGLNEGTMTINNTDQNNNRNN